MALFLPDKDSVIHEAKGMPLQYDRMQRLLKSQIAKRVDDILFDMKQIQQMKKVNPNTNWTWVDDKMVEISRELNGASVKLLELKNTLKKNV